MKMNYFERCYMIKFYRIEIFAVFVAWIILYPVSHIYADSFRVAPEKSIEIKLNNNNNVAGCKNLLKIRSRLDLPAGSEGWGGYFLRLTLDGALFSQAPVNIGKKMWHLGKTPILGVENYSSERKAWFIKADSDFIAFNSTIPGDPFARTVALEYMNTAQDRAGYTNAYYDKTFELDGTAGKVLKIENISNKYPIVCEIDFVKAPLDGLLFWEPSAGSCIYPWSFPEDFNLIKGTLKGQGCKDEFIPLMLAVRNQSGADAVFAWQISELQSENNSIVPASAIDIRVQGYLPVAKASVAGESAEETEKKRILGHVNPAVDTLRHAYLDGYALEIPDRLLAINEWKVSSGKSGALWLIIKLPGDAKPGIYRGNLRINQKYVFPVEVEVLPFELAQSGKVYGLWTNSLPGVETRRSGQVRDLREHQINTFFLDAWTVPVGVAADGTPDLTAFKKALKWLNEEKLNQKILIYGLMSPLLTRIAQVAGTDNMKSDAWQKIVTSVLGAMKKTAEAEGFTFYVHGYDEPDVHPDETAAFEMFCHLAKRCGLKTASNATVIGMTRMKDIIDLNICPLYNGVLSAYDGKGKPFTNMFFPQWGSCDADTIKKSVKYCYTQVRSTHPIMARKEYGIIMDAMKLEGMWGFAYYWGGSENWNIAWPFPEADGRYGTTIGWEMLRAGIDDSRYFLTLQTIAAAKKKTVKTKRPNVPEIMQMNMSELNEFRNTIIKEIIDLSKKN